MSAILVAVLLFGNTATLEAGRTALRSFHYEEAVQLLEKARAEGPYRYADHVALYESLGVAYASLDRRAKAKGAFDTLLALDPGHVIAYTFAPKITFLFEAMRRSADRRMPPTLELNWPHGLTVDDPVPIALEVVADPKAFLQRAVVYSRSRGRATYHPTAVKLLPVGQATRIRLPRPAVPKSTPDTVELYAVAVDRAGNEVLTVGDAQNPRRISLSYVQRTPWYRRWWVWAIVGGVVAAASGTTAYLLTREPSPTVEGVLRER